MVQEFPVSGHFEFDQQRTQGTNRVSDAPCPTCDGHRLILEEENDEGFASELYVRCPSCNPAPVTERQPVTDARWKSYDPS
jgi:hypothetical protein